MRRFLGLLFTLYVGLVAAFAFSPRQDATPPAPQIRIDRLLMLDGLALAGGRRVVVGERGRIFLSDDGGMAWRPVASPTEATLTALAVLDDRRLVAVGHDEVILRSSDRGEHWERVWEDTEADGPLLAVRFDAEGEGLAVGAYGRILASRDGGRRWERQVLDIGDPHLNAIARAPGGHWMLAGETGTLLRARAGLRDWEVLDAPYGGSFFGLLRTPGDALLAFGMRGHLYRSRDGGRHWEMLDTGSESSLFGGRILEDGRTLLVGQNGLLLQLEAGGIPRPIDPPRRNTYTGLVAGPGPGVLWLVGEGGITRLETGDGAGAGP